MGLAYRPGLELVHGITSRIEIVVTGDLGQLGSMAAALALVFCGPAEKLTLGATLASGIGGKGNGRHEISPENLTPSTLKPSPHPAPAGAACLHSSSGIP